MGGSTDVQIAAVIAAAGQSRRMGRPKQLLPWGDGTVTTTVIAAVVDNLHAAGAAPILCVIGHASTQMREALRDHSATLVYNDEYQASEMIVSYQTGVRHLREAFPACVGTLIALSDQPHVPPEIVRLVLEQASRTPQDIVIPSHQMRRGHPIYLPSTLWDALLTLPAEQTLRDVIRGHAECIRYVNVDSDVILRDMDTPEDYAGLMGEA